MRPLRAGHISTRFGLGRWRSGGPRLPSRNADDHPVSVSQPGM